MNEDVLMPADVQRMACVAWGTVQSWAKSGKLRAWKPKTGHPYRFRRCDVHAFLRERGIPFAGAVEVESPDVLMLTQQSGFAEAIQVHLPDGISLHRAATDFEAGVTLRQFPPLVVLVDETWPEVVLVVEQILAFAQWKPVVVPVKPITLDAADPERLAKRLAQYVTRSVERAQQGKPSSQRP
ncbi:MAG: hypothetical protein MPJ50_05340 [Pirellulales bacterium]|nr:hypothetical protein [Pirellulales bacterium]